MLSAIAAWVGMLGATPADVVALEEQHRAALFEKVAPAVVFLANASGFGSGFFVQKDGLVLTNRHVVGSAAEVDVVLQNGERLIGRVVERAENIDLALVQVERTGVPTLPTGAASELRVGSWVASVGHGRGAIWSFNVGMVSNIYTEGNDEPVFQTQIPLNPGNSGGPIIDRHGRVVGVVTAGMADSNSINFGIKIDIAIRSLAGLEPLCGACLVVTTPGRENVFVDGDMMGTGPRLVLSIGPGRHEVFAIIDGQMRKAHMSFPAQRRVRLDAAAPGSSTRAP